MKINQVVVRSNRIVSFRRGVAQLVRAPESRKAFLFVEHLLAIIVFGWPETLGLTTHTSAHRLVSIFC